MLKPGGKMVYATCSILPSENQNQVQTFLSSEAGKDFVFVSDKKVLDHALNTLPMTFLPMSEESSLYAADIWRSYRNAGGLRKRMVADFLVAAHATCQADRLLSRDRGFYRTHFQNLKLIEP